jgi:hypothetical protein
MQSQSSLIAYALVSLLGAGIFLAFLLLYPPNLTSIGKRARTVTVDLQGITRRDYGFGSTALAEVDWALRLAYPNRAPKDSTVLVHIGAEIEKVVLHAPRNRFRLTEEEIREDAWEKLASGAVSLVLNLPSAKVSPERINSLPRDKKVAWSVYLPVTGIHEGVIASEVNSRGNLKLKESKQSTIRIDVFEPLVSTRNILSLLGLILGPLISVPGIYAFVREVRRDQEKRRETEKENASKIILP